MRDEEFGKLFVTQLRDVAIRELDEHVPASEDTPDQWKSALAMGAVDGLEVLLPVMVDMVLELVETFVSHEGRSFTWLHGETTVSDVRDPAFSEIVAREIREPALRHYAFLLAGRGRTPTTDHWVEATTKETATAIKTLIPFVVDDVLARIVYFLDTDDNRFTWTKDGVTLTFPTEIVTEANAWYLFDDGWRATFSAERFEI